MPLLSVMMPVHNGEKYVRKAVGSTLAALPRDGELRIHDDGSTDATLTILRSIEDERLVVTTSANRGLVPTLNDLVSAADSRFVARMDADDICAPWRFRRQLALARHVDLVFGSTVKLPRGLPRPELPGRVTAQAVPWHLLSASFLCHPTMLARRSVLGDSPYRQLAAEDYDLWLRLAADGATFVRDDVPALVYRLHDEQVSASAEWDAARRVPREVELTLSAFSALASRCGIKLEPTPAVLYFAESMSTEPGAEDEVCEWLAAVRGGARLSLGPVQRALLEMRLRSVERRLGNVQRQA